MENSIELLHTFKSECLLYKKRKPVGVLVKKLSRTVFDWKLVGLGERCLIGTLISQLIMIFIISTYNDIHNIDWHAHNFTTFFIWFNIFRIVLTSKNSKNI